MTLIVAIPAKDGVVFASDTQVTTGHVRSKGGQKILKLNNNALWGASGQLAVIQRVAEGIEAFPQKDQPLASIRDQLAGIVNNAVASLLRLNFRTQFLKSPDELLGLHPADFLFVEHRNGACVVLHVLHDGTTEWVEKRCAATGNGDLFAHTLLAKFARLIPLSRDKAKLLAYKVIEEAIEVGAYGLGSPIAVWEISDAGAVPAGNEELKALEDSAELLRQSEVSMFEEQAAPEPAAAPADAPAPVAAAPGQP